MSEKKEYIERGALLEPLQQLRNLLVGETAKQIIGTAITHVKFAPAEDVEPVVRCKDCINQRELYGDGLKSMYNEKWCEDQGRIVQENGFCECGAQVVRAMPFNPQSVEDEKKACADYFERLERSGSGE